MQNQRRRQPRYACKKVSHRQRSGRESGRRARGECQGGTIRGDGESSWFGTLVFADEPSAASKRGVHPATSPIRKPSSFIATSFQRWFPPSHHHCRLACGSLIPLRSDLTELELPDTMKTHFPDPADLLNFELTITPDEGTFPSWSSQRPRPLTSLSLSQACTRTPRFPSPSPSRPTTRIKHQKFAARER